MTAATILARKMVVFRLVNTPISPFWLVKIIKGMIVKGSPKLNTTWLITRVRGGVQSDKNNDE